MKKTIIPILFIVFILLANLSFASYSTVTMSVVEEPICTIQIGENSKFEKKLISKDLSNKEVTLQLQITNEETPEKPTGELMLVIDNSLSMEEKTATDKTRKELVFESAQTLVNSLLKDNNQLKVGIVSFSTNTDVQKEGTIADASLVSELSDNSTNLTNAISNIEANGPRTDLESGLKLASQYFSTEENNKYMIVLTDGVPNVAIDYDKTYYSDDVINKTKAQFQNLIDNNINIITMLTGISNETSVPTGVTKTYGEIIKEIFGTTQSPNYDKFYYITDDQIEATITNDIYKTLVPEAKSLKNITIVDYFPQEIIKNFDFAYVSKANIGDISATVDTQTNSITWTIPELEYGKTATVQYKLKLKENFDSSIISKVLNTNEKVDIDYTNINGEKETKTSNVSPKLQLEEPPVTLPYAGTIAFITFSVIAVLALVFSLTKLMILNNNMKQ
jgi:hypothetical protein